MYLLIEVFEFSACIAEKEFAFDPDGEAKDVGEKQRAVCCDRLQVRVQDEAAPRHEEVHLTHQPETEREKDQRGDEDGIRDHMHPFHRDSLYGVRGTLQKKCGEDFASPRKHDGLPVILLNHANQRDF